MAVCNSGCRKYEERRLGNNLFIINKSRKKKQKSKTDLLFSL